MLIIPLIFQVLTQIDNNNICQITRMRFWSIPDAIARFYSYFKAWLYSKKNKNELAQLQNRQDFDRKELKNNLSRRKITKIYKFCPADFSSSCSHDFSCATKKRKTKRISKRLNILPKVNKRENFTALDSKVSSHKNFIYDSGDEISPIVNHPEQDSLTTLIHFMDDLEKAKSAALRIVVTKPKTAIQKIDITKKIEPQTVRKLLNANQGSNPKSAQIAMPGSQYKKSSMTVSPSPQFKKKSISEAPVYFARMEQKSASASKNKNELKKCQQNSSKQQQKEVKNTVERNQNLQSVNH